MNEMTTQQISRENKASRVSNLVCGWNCQAISVTSVTLYGPSLERIRCVKSRPVTVIWVPSCFGYPRTQIPSVLGIPSRDTQNTESVKYCRLGQVKSSKILLKNHIFSYEALS